MFIDVPTSFEVKESYSNLLDSSWLSDDEYEELFEYDASINDSIIGLICSTSTDLSDVSELPFITGFNDA